jgi:CubicO group peptidase (beta-lactamase class C family)
VTNIGTLLAIGLAVGIGVAHARSCPEETYGGWTTSLPIDALLRTRLVVSNLDEEVVELNQPSIRFVGKARSDSSALDGFVYFGQNAYRVTLPKTDEGTWSGTWVPLPTAESALPIDLYIDDDGEGGTGGYLFFRDQRMPSLYGLGARCDGGLITFSEMNLGLTFSGDFDDELTVLTTQTVGMSGTATITWKRMSEAQLAKPAGSPILPPRDPIEATVVDQAPEATDDGWPTAKPSEKNVDIAPVDKLIKSVSAGELPLVHSVLVAKSGELIVEEYFYGFDRDTIHDMRSASKSIASTLVGLAIDRELISGADANALDFLNYESIGNWSNSKAKISLRHLMTMSSGLDANDSDRSSVASENAYQWQREQPDWIKFALDAPMIAEPGERVIYGSANPMILGGVLESATGSPVEWFADQALFKPLGIENYIIYMRPRDAGVYLGGGMYLRPRDMLKIGQLYLDGGKWQGRQILSKEWIDESFESYGRLEPIDRNGNQYGYLWWHETYEVGDRVIASVEARGNGGQYIFIVPELDIVAVITAGNYRGGLEMTRQSQRMFASYVLPALSGG